MTLQLAALGVGGAFSQKYYSTSIVVFCNGGTVLIDCPHPIRKMLKEAQLSVPIDVGDIDTVLVSHLHADHSSGLEGFLFYSRFRIGKRASLAAHGRVLERLWNNHLAAGMDTLEIEGKTQTSSLSDFADTIELYDNSVVKTGAFEVACRQTKHHIPTYAFKLYAEGRAVGFSADTDFDPTLIEWLSECDLIIHETNIGIHTPYEKLAELPLSLRKKMRLIHYPDNFATESSAIEPMLQGKLITIK